MASKTSLPSEGVESEAGPGLGLNLHSQPVDQPVSVGLGSSHTKDENLAKSPAEENDTTEDEGGATTLSLASVEDFEDVPLSSGLGKEVSPGPPQHMVTAWDPWASTDWDLTPPSFHCLNRIKRDLATIYREPPPGMFVVPEPEDMTKINALIIGPFDTPYEGGFFHFMLRCPPNYPCNPPRVKLVTTGEGSVRFNPNFYKNGKVCLSILGTWSGPSWSPALSLSSLLISIQSLMSDRPYHNEPGYERERRAGEVNRYNRIIQHETIRVAVLDSLVKWSAEPGPLFKVATTSLPDFIDHFETVCLNNLNSDGEEMRDPFGEKRGFFQWNQLLNRLRDLREQHPQWWKQDSTQEAEGSSDVSELSDS